MITEQFVTRIKLLVRDCPYKDPDEMERDRIVFGTSWSKVRETYKCNRMTM